METHRESVVDVRCDSDYLRGQTVSVTMPSACLLELKRRRRGELGRWAVEGEGWHPESCGRFGTELELCEGVVVQLWGGVRVWGNVEKQMRHIIFWKFFECCGSVNCRVLVREATWWWLGGGRRRRGGRMGGVKAELRDGVAHILAEGIRATRRVACFGTGSREVE